MAITLTSLIDTAVRLHEAEGHLLRWEVETDLVSAEIATATPARLARICREISRVTIGVDGAFRLHVAVQPDMRGRPTTGLDDETTAVLLDQALRNSDVGERIVAVRQRFRRLHGDLGGRIADLRGMNVAERIMLLLVDGQAATRTNVAATIRQHHEEVADAWTAWRSMGERWPHALLFTAGSDTDDEIDAALHDLLGRGLVTRHRSFAGTRWSPAVADRKAA